MPCRFLSARGTAIGKPAGHSPAAARAIVERQLAIVHRRWRVLVDDGACHLRVEFSKRLVWRQRTRAIVASEDKRPGGELVLALEIQAGRPGSSIRPGPLWMALAPRLGQLGNSHGVQCDRHQTVHSLQPNGSDGKTNSPKVSICFWIESTSAGAGIQATASYMPRRFRPTSRPPRSRYWPFRMRNGRRQFRPVWVGSNRSPPASSRRRVSPGAFLHCSSTKSPLSISARDWQPS